MEHDFRVEGSMHIVCRGLAKARTIFIQTLTQSCIAGYAFKMQGWPSSALHRNVRGRILQVTRLAAHSWIITERRQTCFLTLDGRSGLDLDVMR